MNCTRKKSSPRWSSAARRLRPVAVAAPLLAMTTLTGFAQDLDILPPSLKELPARARAQGVPLEPPTLLEYVKDKEAAILLGKALFWDMQVGSDGMVACASCHFHAGADNRSKNQLSPGLNDLGRKKTGDPRFGNAKGARGYSEFGPNYQLELADFPLHKRTNPDLQLSRTTRDTNDVVASQGVVLKQFAGINPAGAEDAGVTLDDPIFQLKLKNSRQNARQVEPLNAPSVVNAVFNFANFWNGRANHFFNGENPFGPAAGPDAGIWVERAGQLAKTPLRLPVSSLASQALGPPVSDLEMSWRGRTWAQIGRKLVGATPLAKQMVLPGDSVLGVLSQDPDPGLRTTYRELIEKAFHDQYWNSPGRVIQFNAASAPMKMADQQDPRSFRLNNGKGTVRVKSSQVLAVDEYTQMEANFAFFFGLAVQLYQATLVSDDARYDQFMEGSLTLNPEEQRGLDIFMNEGRCIQCHGGSLFTNAAIDVVQGIDGVEEEGMIEAMPVATGAMTLYDTGFYNIAVRPTSEDLGRGGTAPFVNPLTGERFPLSFTRLAWLKDAGLLPVWYRDLVPFPAAGIFQDAVDGAMKTPGLRNVELTGPYFRNGDSATLMQVIDLYTRGGNFPRINQDNLSPLMGEIVPLQGNEADQKALVAFLLTLTDDRVKYEQAPFDHPQLFVVNGHNDLTLEDEIVEIPAVDAEGRRDPLRPFLAPDGMDAYTFHTTP